MFFSCFCKRVEREAYMHGASFGGFVDLSTGLTGAAIHSKLFQLVFTIVNPFETDYINYL